MAQHPQAQQTASGVEALIARLREEGVSAGRGEAEKLVADAQAQARAIVGKAEAEAKATVAAASSEADKLRRGGEDALRVAMRDTVLDLKSRLAQKFADDIFRAVSSAMRDETLLREMILTVVGRARAEARLDDSTQAEVILPRVAVGLDELRRKPEELREGSLAGFVADSVGSLLREGVVFGRADDEEGGIRVVLGDRGVTVDMTDKAVADVLLSHLQPRFHALLEGVVK
jgi:V/A-type H+-transporting ATPase subunit E